MRKYFLFLKNEKRFAPPSLKIAFRGIKFFFTQTVPREWPTLETLRGKRHKTLPDVLTIDTAKIIAPTRSNCCTFSR